jgi:hypothetical protein
MDLSYPGLVGVPEHHSVFVRKPAGLFFISQAPSISLLTQNILSVVKYCLADSHG